MGIFKAYDVRGKYPEEVNETIAYKIGRAMTVFLNAKSFLVCQDAREGSKELAEAFMKGVTDQGANATFSGLATTPMFYYFKYKKDFDAGVMITASHLPAGYNGLKAMKQGRQFMSSQAGYKEIEEMIYSGKIDEVPLSETKGEISKANYEQEYIEFVTSSAIGNMKDLKVVVDGSNAMAGPIMKKILDKLGVDYVGLNMDYNLENPAHGLNPLEKPAQQEVKDKVLEIGADLGAVFDADADRIIFIDEKGEDLPGDYALAILTDNLANSGDVIVHDLLCGGALKEVIARKECKAIETRVGHVFIKGAMVDNNGRFGAEASGHMYFGEAGGAESTILCLLDMIGIVNQGKPLSELTKPLKKSYLKSPELNYELDSNELKDQKIEEVASKFSDGKQSKLDGIKISYDDAWISVRKSNTEPVLRLRVEAKSEERLNNLISVVEGIIKS